ncbi:MAG: hypothetical protein KDD28_35940, partial [Phaeodactylibacter sp.]|nr:hypothetical protein [Phaeodactylibacter sp.]
FRLRLPCRYPAFLSRTQFIWCKQVNGIPVAGHFSLSPGYLNIISNHTVESESYVLRLNQADGSLVWSKIYLGANYAPLFSNVNLISRPQNGLAWLATADDVPAMAIAQVGAQGEVEGCITHSPCNVSVMDAPFPEYTPINWTEEDYPAFEPVILLEEPFTMVATPYSPSGTSPALLAARIPLTGK